MRGTILITRPIEDAIELVASLQQKNYDVICEPFLDVVFHDRQIDDLETYEGLIFTSKNAVRAFGQDTQNRELPVWTVGDATQDLAIELGFKDVQSASGDLKALQGILPQKRLLYIRGEHVSGDLTGSDIHEEILYHTDMKQKISKNTLDMIGNGAFSHIVFFSTRTADAFTTIIEHEKLGQGLVDSKVLCLGSSMIKSVSVLPWKEILVANQPDRDSVVKLLD